MINKLMGIVSGDKGQLVLKVTSTMMAALLIAVGQIQPFDAPIMPG